MDNRVSPVVQEQLNSLAALMPIVPFMSQKDLVSSLQESMFTLMTVMVAHDLAQQELAKLKETK